MASGFLYIGIGTTRATLVATESTVAAESTSSLDTGMLAYIHLVHGNIETAEPLLEHFLGETPNLDLAHYSLLEIFLASNRCEEKEPSVNCLGDYFKKKVEKVSLENALVECYENRL